MLISLQHVSAGYGKPKTTEYVEILNDVSFTFPEGGRVCIAGQNGSGKTTLMRVIAGLLPYRGHVCIGETKDTLREISRMKRREVAERIALMPQFPESYFSYTVTEAVLLGRYVHMKNRLGVASQADRETVARTLERTGLAEIADRQIDELSGGQLQRVMLARTLVQETPVILLDEPSNHLDMRYQAELTEILKAWADPDLSGNLGKPQPRTLISVFNNLWQAMDLADIAVFMREGRILASGCPSEIMSPELLKDVYGFDAASYIAHTAEAWQSAVDSAADPRILSKKDKKSST
ncbi:MAG: ABC transporter ATP-binding protein [Lachnospiraceae bacterium]|jgi:iron complex transport system ATP-binding protein|nr:ABC transporter ATP-binding protein [Lachnospiraceae bacterium]